MDESDLHPPSVVLFSSQHIGFGGRRTPDSPLSSAPGSPNSGRFDELIRSRTDSSNRTPAGGVFPAYEEAGNELHVTTRQHRREKSTEVPFDENVARDEKKIEEYVSPEESGMVPMITLSKRKEDDPILQPRFKVRVGEDDLRKHSEPLGPEDEQQLGRRESDKLQVLEEANGSTDMVLPSLSKPKLQRPSMISRRKTTGDILSMQGAQQVTPSPGRGNRERNCLTTEDADRAKMQQHMNFAALKRDILSAEWSLQRLQKENASETPQTSETAPESLSTPLPDLRTPPSIRLRANVENGNRMISGDLYSSFGSPDGAWPSFYSSNYGDGRAEGLAIPLATAASSMARSGTTRQAAQDCAPLADYSAKSAGLPRDEKHDRNMENLSVGIDIQYSKDSQESRVSSNGPIGKDEGGSQRTEFTDNRSRDQAGDSRDEEDDNLSNGCNDGENKPGKGVAGSAFDAAIVKGLNDAFTDAAMTQRILTDAYGVGPEGTTATGEFILNHNFGAAVAAAGPFGIPQSLSSSDDAYLRKFSSLRSSSDLSETRKLATESNQSQVPSNDWSKYLSGRGIEASSESTRAAIDRNDTIRDQQLGRKWKSEHGYRKMTPKKDIQSSENSAWWLEEELRRRSIIKREINAAILARSAANDVSAENAGPSELNSSFARQLAYALENISPRVGESLQSHSFAEEIITRTDDYCQEDIEFSSITHDKNDAWIKGDGSRDVQNLNDGKKASKDFAFQQLKSDLEKHDDSPLDKPRPRRLIYEESTGMQAASGSTTARHSATETAVHRRYGSDDTSEKKEDDGMFDQRRRHRSDPSKATDTDPVDPPSMLKLDVREEHEDPSSLSIRQNGSAAEQMKRFASETRAALRGQSGSQIREGGRVDSVSGTEQKQLNNSIPRAPPSPFRSIELSESASSMMQEDSHAAQSIATTTIHPHPTKLSGNKIGNSLGRTSSSEAGSLNPGEPNMISAGAKRGEKVSIQANVTPTLIQSMDSKHGIAKGDITLSLLNENTGREESSKNATWAGRVHGAVWRCRRMRRCIDGQEEDAQLQAGNPSKGRSSLPVDMDNTRVAGGYRSVASTQDAALLHLMHDEIDEAMELFEDIIFAYYAYFEQSLKAREQNPNLQGGLGTTDFKPFIGVALHNLGILNLLNGDYKEALSFFVRAVENRKACLGEGHPDHVVSGFIRLTGDHFMALF